MSVDLNRILKEFNVESKIENYGNGHINDTYCTETPKYILQRINTNVFKNPDNVMENIENVTSFLRKKIIKNGGNPLRETLTVVPTANGKNCFKYDDNNVFRLYHFISDTKTVEDGKNSKDMYNAGKGFGRFQRLLDDYPVETLHETIVDFHNTPKRIEALKKAINEDCMGRADSVKEEIEYALSNSKFASVVLDGIKSGEIPIRVTHNDTKINNILFDNKTGEAVCVIDLDTVMPGSMLYDFGDALRTGGATAAEDEIDLTKVNFDIESYRNFAKGYLSEVGDVLTPMEKNLLPMGVWLLTYENGIRFLTDYLNGDVYFKIHREKHNLDRARNQFKLCEEIMNKKEELEKIGKEII